MALWEAFSQYGKVMDVYISFYDRAGKARVATFAFVRYKSRTEMVKAIFEGSNRKMDGRFIRVKEALRHKETISQSQPPLKIDQLNHSKSLDRAVSCEGSDVDLAGDHIPLKSEKLNVTEVSREKSAA
ncbi:hypothetical protein REPUB_Repub08aG0197100 [Reevesia pubescens]